MIAEKIKHIRIGLGKSMEEFGDLFEPKASKGVVSNWENNYNLPNNERLKRIAELGRISIEELMQETSSLKIGDRIKELRKEKGFTQNELAEFSGLSRSYLSDVENSRKNPSVETVEKLAESFGMKLVIRFENNWLGAKGMTIKLSDYIKNPYELYGDKAILNFPNDR